MIQDEYRDDSEESRDWFDEAYRWRWFTIGVGLLILIPVLGIWIFTEWTLPSWFVPSLLITLIGFAVSLIVGLAVALPVALSRAEPPEQRALAVLDPPHADYRFRVHYFTPEEWSEIDVRWGELVEISGTSVPCKMALTFDPERLLAYGPHRSSLSPDEMERTLYHLDEYYGKQEEEAAQATALRHQIRTLARRAAERIAVESDRQYDEATLPTGDVITELIRDSLPEKEDTDSLADESDDETGEADGHQEGDREQMLELFEEESANFVENGGVDG